MSQIKSEIIINAPIESIWNHLLNFNSYAQWNPFIKEIVGEPVVNSKLTITIQPMGKKPMKFYPKILTIANYHFSWLGSMGIKGVFDGEHNFKLEQISMNQVRLLHFEKFTGILHKPVLMLIRKSIQTGFDDMNLALKNLCELDKVNNPTG